MSDVKNLDDILFVPDHGQEHPNKITFKCILINLYVFEFLFSYRLLYLLMADDSGNYTEIFKMSLFPGAAKKRIQKFSIHMAPMHLVFDQRRNTLAA